MNKFKELLKELKLSSADKRIALVENFEIVNFVSNEISEYNLEILKKAALNEGVLNKLIEDEDIDLSMDEPAPAEDNSNPFDEVDTDSTAEENETDDTENPFDDGSDDSVDTDTTDTANTEDDPFADETTNSDDMTDETDTDPDEDTDDDEDEEDESSNIETSAEGVGILPLIAEIQKRLANGKPTEVELAALKALRKLVK